MSKDKQDLIVNEGDQINLLPNSETFKNALQIFHPKTISEVRQILGPTKISEEKTQFQSNFCLPAELTSRIIPLEELEAKDENVRYRARSLAYSASKVFVKSVDNSHLSHWEPILDKYIQISNVVLMFFNFNNIIVQNGGSLIVANTIHGLSANEIKLYGSGKIVCNGPMTIKAKSFEGNLMSKYSTIGPKVPLKDLSAKL